MSSAKSHKAVVNLIVSIVICVAIIIALMLPGWILPKMNKSSGSASAAEESGEEAAAEASAVSGETSGSTAAAPAAQYETEGTAQTQDQIEAPSTTCFKGDVVVSYVTKDMDKGTIVIRVDNNTSAEIVTFGMPTDNVDGTDIIVSYPANQAVNAVKVPAGEFRTIAYKVNSDALAGKKYVFGGKFKATDGYEDSDLTYSLEFETD